MSSQGSVDGASEAESRHMLESWGMWARSGDLGIGFISPAFWKKPSLGIPYTDGEMMMVDSVVASLPSRAKRIIKKVYLHADYRGVSDEDIAGAIGHFHASFFEGSQ